MTDADWALVLNLHQPSGNLDAMAGELDERTGERGWPAKEVLWALDRIPRSLWEYEDVGRVHLSLSGTLLEALADPAFQQRVYGVVDCGSLLWHLQNTAIVQVLGTGHYHPVFPLVPRADWDEQLRRWWGLAGHLFNRSFSGFWPPEMGFTMELIPHLARQGYRYVLVDSEHVRPVGRMRWEELMYRPHVARYGGAEIVVVVRDRDLSNAQESGMEVDWFRAEVAARTKWCDFRPLVTTATDGENGGWFRNTGHNFWSAFYRPFLDGVRAGVGPVVPTFVDDHLDRYGVHGEVTVEDGAWNTGWHHGNGFVQWTGSAAQQETLARLADLSEQIHAGFDRAADAPGGERALLDEAYWRLLRAETSCNFFWGEEWLGRCTDDLDAAGDLVAAVGRN